MGRIVVAQVGTAAAAQINAGPVAEETGKAVAAHRDPSHPSPVRGKSRESANGAGSVQCADVDEEYIAAVCRGFHEVGVEAVQGEQHEGGVVRAMPLVCRQGLDVLEAFEVLDAPGLDGGLRLYDQGDGRPGVLEALPGHQGVQPGGWRAVHAE
jgi:hypothetical protein